jgi:hypothetical protein
MTKSKTMTTAAQPADWWVGHRYWFFTVIKTCHADH